MLDLLFFSVPMIYIYNQAVWQSMLWQRSCLRWVQVELHTFVELRLLAMISLYNSEYIPAL